MIQHNRTKAIDDTAIAVEYFGSAPSFGIMGAFYLGGAFLDNYKAKRVAMDAFAASLISAGMITTALKVVAGRSRPDEDNGTYRFQPFGGDHSFPSGHTTQAFSLASVIAEHYDEWWVDAISYGIAAGVGFARIEQEAHFPSDVVAGAVIGAVVGKTLVRYNRGFYRGITLTPSGYGSDTGINLRITF
ncbi:MAG: phosphatase PAP2 family protein [Nitrospirae bacterium]|nr:phosphatase PAP2 family protein [Nitrospirota bacterium]